MGKRSNILFRLLYIASSVLLFGILWNALRVIKNDSSDLEITIEVSMPFTDDLQLFFDPSDIGYHESNSSTAQVDPGLGYQTVAFTIGSETELHGLRIDPGTGAGVVKIRNIKIAAAYATWELSPADIDSVFEFNAVCHTSLEDPEVLVINISGEDPFFSSRQDLITTINALHAARRPVLWPFLISLFTTLLVLFLLFKLDPISFAIHGRKDLGRLLMTLWNRRTALALCMGALSWWLVNSYFKQVDFVEQEVSLILSGTFSNSDEFQLYYNYDGRRWSAEDHLSRKVTGNTAPQLIQFKLEPDMVLEDIRIDLGTVQTCVVLDSISLVTANAHHTWSPKKIKYHFIRNGHIQNAEIREDRLELDISGNDAFMRSRTSISSIQEDLMERSNTGEEAHYFAWAISLLVFFSLRGFAPTLARIPKEKRPAYILSASFGLLIFIPLLSRIVPIEPAAYNTEKRAMSERPVLEASTLMEYPAAYNAYYSDNFGYRRALIRWNALLKGAGMGVSPNKSAVLFGKEDWMFYMGEGVDDHHRNAKLFSTEQLEIIQRKFENRYHWLKDQGIDYYITIPPVKSTIYPEYMPNRMTIIRDTSKLDQLIDHLAVHSFIEVIDMRDTFFAEKKKDLIYYKIDTHWNVLGAYFGYKVLIERIAQDHPEIVPMERAYFSTKSKMVDEADLSQMSGLNDIFLRKEVMLFPKNKFKSHVGERSEYKLTKFFKYEPEFYDNDSISDLKMVIFRDSYAVYLRPFLSEHFSRSSYIWTPIFHPEVIDVDQPDIVIHEVMERFIDDLMLNDPGEPRYVQ